MPNGLNAYEQYLGIEDEHKGQYGSPYVVGESLDAGFDGIALGYGRCGKGGQTDGRGIIGQDPEEEDEQMGRDQRHH